MLVIIDPGHGGKDLGGGSNQYWDEKEMTLKLSLYQYERFKELGVPVGLTRREDVFLNPQDRTRIVRESGADICISNHINYFSNSQAEGAEVIHSIHTNGKLANMILDELVNRGATGRRAFSKENPNNPGQDYYFMHRLTGSVETVIIEYGFASNESDTEKILKNWRSYAEGVVKVLCAYIGHPYDEDANLTAIMGESKAPLMQMKNWARSNNGTERFIQIAEYYYKYGALTGIRADLLYAQSAKETRFGKYTGAVKEDMNNFAGIKIENPNGNKREDYESFSTIDDGIRAHFNHIAAYIGIEPIGEPHPRYYVVKSLDWSGKVKYAEELGGKWAPSTSYGKSVVKDYLNGILETEVDNNDYKTLYENCKAENEHLRKLLSDFLY